MFLVKPKESSSHLVILPSIRLYVFDLSIFKYSYFSQPIRLLEIMNVLFHYYFLNLGFLSVCDVILGLDKFEKINEFYTLT